MGFFAVVKFKKNSGPYIIFYIIMLIPIWRKKRNEKTTITGTMSDNVHFLGATVVLTVDIKK